MLVVPNRRLVIGVPPGFWVLRIGVEMIIENGRMQIHAVQLIHKPDGDESSCLSLLL